MTDGSRIEKAPDAFRTISEVSEALDVPQHVLRFWEAKFTQIKPLKRAGGRRYYRPDDIDLLKGIRALLYGEGFTIKGVQKVLRERPALIGLFVPGMPAGSPGMEVAPGQKPDRYRIHAFDARGTTTVYATR